MKDYPISLAPATSALTNPSLVDPSEGLYLSLPDVAALGTLPEAGEITFRFKRRSLNLRTDSGEPVLSAELCLCEIVEIEADPAAEKKHADVVDELFAEAQRQVTETEDD